MSKRDKNKRHTPKKPQPASSAQSEKLLNRRRWFGAAATAAGAVTIAGGILYHGKDTPGGGDPALRDEPITQQDVDIEYAALFSLLSQAKQKAEDDGKKLAVLAGEVHNNRNSLLLQFMLVDIAHRLGITDIMEEKDTPTVARMEADAETELRQRDRMIAASLRAAPDPAVAQFAKRAFLISSFKSLRHDPIYSTENKVDGNNTFLSMMTGKDVGMHFHSIDPSHSERYAAVQAGDQDIALSEKFEKPMFDEISKITKSHHALGFIGAGHAPELSKWLKDAGAHVIGIDCSGGLRLRNEALPPVMRKRMDALDELYVPRINSRRQHSPSVALGMALKASVKHQQEHGELKSADSHFVTHLIDKISPQEQTIHR